MNGQSETILVQLQGVSGCSFWMFEYLGNSINKNPNFIMDYDITLKFWVQNHYQFNNKFELIKK